jgi:hypothetical protein
MRRREFIAGLGATITGSIQTNAQELPSLAFVGYLDDGPAQGYHIPPGGISRVARWG